MRRNFSSRLEPPELLLDDLRRSFTGDVGERRSCDCRHVADVVVNEGESDASEPNDTESDPKALDEATL